MCHCVTEFGVVVSAECDVSSVMSWCGTYCTAAVFVMWEWQEWTAVSFISGNSFIIYFIPLVGLLHCCFILWWLCLCFIQSSINELLFCFICQWQLFHYLSHSSGGFTSLLFHSSMTSSLFNSPTTSSMFHSIQWWWTVVFFHSLVVTLSFFISFFWQVYFIAFSFTAGFPFIPIGWENDLVIDGNVFNGLFGNISSIFTYIWGSDPNNTQMT